MNKYITMALLIVVPLVLGYIEYNYINTGSVLFTLILICTYYIVAAINQLTFEIRELIKILKKWLNLR